MKSTSNSLQQLVLRETDDGLRLVRFLVDVMDAEIEGVKIADRAARRSRAPRPLLRQAVHCYRPHIGDLRRHR